MFKPFKSNIAYIEKENIDTDAIIPKQFLKSIKKTGFGKYLFDEWRYLDKGEPGQDCKNRPLNKDFILNKFEYADSKILLAGKNFGCGSSREHAPWALKDYGFRCIISESFADIFYNNCFKNGILPVILKPDKINKLFSRAKSDSRFELYIDLDNQHITDLNEKKYLFEIEPFRKNTLLLGKDEIQLTLDKFSKKIKIFEEKHKKYYPWLFKK